MEITIGRDIEITTVKSVFFHKIGSYFSLLVIIVYIILPAGRANPSAGQDKKNCLALKNHTANILCGEKRILLKNPLP